MIICDAEKPIAAESPDHLYPRGTAIDNSTNLMFNSRLLWLIPASRLRVLDLGCAGGGFVKSVMDDGGFAVGIEGSDYSKRRGRAEWKTIPGNLFTADVTRKFTVSCEDGRGISAVKFNVVTAWELLEHIPEEKLAGLFENIARHLLPNGIVIVSVSTKPDKFRGIDFHRTVKDRQWWLAKAAELGFVNHPGLVAYFGDEWVRGPLNGLFSFNMVLCRKDEQPEFDNKPVRRQFRGGVGRFLRRQRVRLHETLVRIVKGY